ncbi:kunitz/BPTI-like toxin [Crotalus tigris]|uniref:kunitz/BPTI-like toxin n=1 Tax=Crotalus tigris TaxID=88082 RepID=UPI00192F1D07|nr:kunitz/BPTI-like toxin [Crotalus tigris]
MSSGSLLLLLGLLSLWAELTPVSSQDRPSDCVPAEPGPCRGAITRFYYNSDSNKCQEFTYGGCRGNANNFKTKNKCLGVSTLCLSEKPLLGILKSSQAFVLYTPGLDVGAIEDLGSHRTANLNFTEHALTIWRTGFWMRA